MNQCSLCVRWVLCLAGGLLLPVHTDSWVTWRPEKAINCSDVATEKISLLFDSEICVLGIKVDNF